MFSGRINDTGEVYLDADIVHVNDPFTPTAAIYRIAPGTSALELVARVGGPVPGLPEATFTLIDIGRLFETGHYLWIAHVQGSGISAANNHGAFLTAPSIVLRSGDVVDIRGDGSDLRVVSDFGVSRDPRSGGSAVRQVFELRFTHGSAGAFVGSVP